MKIEVKQEHIDKGTPNDGNACPIWHAIREQFGPLDVTADPDFIVIEHMMARPPDSAEKFMCRFDAGLPVEPFAFDLDIDEALIR